MCSFIKTGLYLNDAFQQNSLKLLLPPQNVSISKQGGLGSFHFADGKIKSIEKTCRLFKFHHKPLTDPGICGVLSHSLAFFYGLKWIFGITALRKRAQKYQTTHMQINKHQNKKNPQMFSSFSSLPVVFSFLFLFFTYTICLLFQDKSKL